MSRRAQIADAVVAKLRGGTFAESFTTGRKYVPILTLEALGLAGFSATVWIGKEVRSVFSRGQTKKELDIHIGLESLIEPTTDPANPTKLTELDTLMQVAEQVAGFLELTPAGGLPLAGGGGSTGASWIKTVILGPYSTDSLRTERVFASAVVLTFVYL